MSRAYNFSAGPATLPEPVLRQAQAEMLEFGSAGASIVELSHRGPEFIAVAQQTEADLRTLLSIPDDYAVLFTAGGATTTQALLPLNFAEGSGTGRRGNARSSSMSAPPISSRSCRRRTAAGKHHGHRKSE